MERKPKDRMTDLMTEAFCYFLVMANNEMSVEERLNQMQFHRGKINIIMQDAEKALKGMKQCTNS
jgi:hypothetical protein